MKSTNLTFPAVLALAALAFGAAAAYGQSRGEISGTVRVRETGEPLHRASVRVLEVNRVALSDDDGRFTFRDLPPGRYHVVAHLDSLFTEASRPVEVRAGQTAAVEFLLGLREERYEVTVTASERPVSTFDSFQSVAVYDAYDLAKTPSVSLGEALDNQVGTGIAKRSFGPGTSRPIIRGFDGDRVLVMQDGIRTGALSSQSGDHGELVNPAQIERLEVVKGPATLLYSGSAMGGTVNAISRHHAIHQHAHQGLRGHIQGSAGTTNALGGANAGFEYGAGRWMLWGQGGGVRTGDYDTPQGSIFNSASRITNGGGGFGWFGDKTYFSLDVQQDAGRYGVPFASEFHGDEHGEDEDDHDEDEDDHDEDEDDHDEELERIRLDSRRQNYRFEWGLRDLRGFIRDFSLKLNYTDWNHKEVEIFEDGGSEIGTRFDQNQFVYRGVFEQRKRGALTGRFGFWGIDRDFEAVGEEALAPPVDQKGFALFALEELDFERVKFQFGGRLETNRYRPAFAERGGGHDGHDDDHDEDEDDDDHDEEIPDAVDRTFTGASAAVGMNAKLWNNGAFVANYAHSYRAPALEELYNFGPHVGNLAFEIGRPDLRAETGNGVDLSLRHRDERVRGELNLFYYDFSNFIFPFATGEVEDGLQVIEFTQRNARFTGAEILAGAAVAPGFWVNAGLDFVDAQDTGTNTPLPRIPPLRAKLGVEYMRGGFRFEPRLIMAAQQHQTFTGETRTPGYAVVDLNASYTWARTHVAHQVSANVFNVGDRLYRNHSSFIKDLAPEIGRGVRFTYMVRFF